MMCVDKIFTFIIAIAFILGGCTSDMANKNVKILIGGGPGTDFCLFELVSENVFEVTLCSIKTFDMQEADFIDEIIDVKRLNFLRQSDNIWSLIKNIEDNGTNEKFYFPVDDVSYVWAIIDGKMYWSIYVSDFDKENYFSQYVNKNLLSLAYKLIELSPVQVGGEHNPLKIPNN